MRLIFAVYLLRGTREVEHIKGIFKLDGKLTTLLQKTKTKTESKL